MRRLLFALALCLSACAGFDIPPGASRDAVVAKMGRPTGVVPLPGGGERLQYSGQPAAQQAWMVDVDASGKVVRSYQALTFDNFNRIQPGWTRQDISREFGPPARVEGVWNWPGPVWTYRWRDNGNADMFFHVYFDERGIVGRAHQSIEMHNFPEPRIR